MVDVYEDEDTISTIGVSETICPRCKVRMEPVSCTYFTHEICKFARDTRVYSCPKCRAHWTEEKEGMYFNTPKDGWIQATLDRWVKK